MTHARTVLRASQHRLTLSAAANDNLNINIRDVDQAYTQTNTNLQRSVLIRPSRISGYPKEFLVQAVRPLHGLPESELHRFHTYHRFHKEKLSMVPSVHDMFFVYTDKFLETAIKF